MSFIKRIPITARFFRSAETQEKLVGGYWFAFSKELTFPYGSVTGEFNPTRELKLLDITNSEFYKNFLKKLEERTKNDSDFNEVKNTLLFPLGFTDFNTYKKYAEILLIPQNPAPIFYLNLEAIYNENRYRCSIRNLDFALMEFLKIQYPMCDGIIADRNLPNIFYNGMHHAEIGLFDTTLMNLVNQIERNSPQEVTSFSIGGGKEFPYTSKPKMLIAIDHSHPLIDMAKDYVENKLKKPIQKNTQTIIGDKSQHKNLIAINHSNPIINKAKEYFEKKNQIQKNTRKKNKNISNKITRKNK
jgi:hypothetical protein